MRNNRRLRRVRFIIYKWLRKIVRLDDSPHSIATGTAIGMFVAMLPIYGFQMITGAAIAAVARVNKLAAALSAWITNPLTIPPFLYFQYHLGRLVADSRQDPDRELYSNNRSRIEKYKRLLIFLAIVTGPLMMYGLPNLYMRVIDLSAGSVLNNPVVLNFYLVFKYFLKIHITAQ